VHKADNLPLSCAVVTKSGSVNFLEPSGPIQASNGSALLSMLGAGRIAQTIRSPVIIFLIFTGVLVQFMTVFWNFTLCSMLRSDVSVGNTTLCKNPKDSHRAIYFFSSVLYMGDRGSTVVKVLCYNSEGRWFGPNWCHWNFSLT